MKTRFLLKSLAAPATVAAGLALTVGCQESNDYRTEKPVIDAPAEREYDATTEEAGESLSDAADAAADAVTPDREIVDIETPRGDVEVNEDPATGDTDVDVNRDETNDE